MISYAENSKEFTTKNLLELINEFSKVSGYNINTQNSITFPYTDNEHVETKI